MQHKWRHWLTRRQGPQPPPTRARARARAGEPTVFTLTWETCRRKCCTCVALPKVQRGVQTWRPLPTWRQGARWRGRTWRQCGVTCPRGFREPGGVAKRDVKMWRHLHVASGSQVAWLDVASKCGVTCPRGLREPGGVAGRGVKTWRHLPTLASGSQVASPDVASKRGQNVASLGHAASGPGGVAGRGVKTWRPATWRQAWPDVASKCGVTGPRGVRARWRRRTWRQNVASLAYVASGSQVASQDVASTCGVTCLRGVREPRAVAGALLALTRVASLGVAERDVKMWHHLPTWRQETWRRRTWRQNVVSGAIDLRGVTGRGVKTWRHEARPPGTCLQNVS